MFIRGVLMALALMGMTSAAASQQAMQLPQGGPQGGMRQFSPPAKVVIPLKWIGGKWVAPFDLVNPGAVVSGPRGMGPPPSGSGGSIPPSSSLMPAPQIMDGNMGTVQPYIPDYLIIDVSGKFVVSLRGRTMADLDMTGAEPLMVTSHFGFMTRVPVELLQVYEDEAALSALTAAHEDKLDGGDIVGAVGKPFLEAPAPIIVLTNIKGVCTVD